MPRFSYKAVSADGEVIEGVIVAASRGDVVERLHRQGHTPIRAEESKVSGLGGLSFSGTWRSKRVRRRDVVLLTRELATLLQAGLPLDRSLTTLIDIAPPGAVRGLVESVLDRVRGGASLADALDDHPDVFANFYVGMVRAGEAGGTLEAVLARLAETMERAQELRSSITSALQYPIIVVVMAVLSLAVLMTKVIPQFRPLFDDAGVALPLSTRIVIGTSDLFEAYWWVLAVVALVVVVAIRQHNRKEAGRLRWDGWLATLPFIGELVRKIEVARFSRTFGTLLSNGVSVLNALSMTTESMGNRAIAQTVTRAQRRLAKGEGLADPLTRSGVFPTLALQLVRVGEETGRLEEMLLRIAEIYDEEVKRTLARLVALIVPLVTVVLGILIAVIIGSILAAILSVYELPL
jgi:general secretion pathway protein F